MLLLTENFKYYFIILTLSFDYIINKKFGGRKMNKKIFKTTFIGLFAALCVIFTMGMAIAADPTISDFTYTPSNPVTTDNIDVYATCSGDFLLYTVEYSVSGALNVTGTFGSAINATSSKVFTILSGQTSKLDAFAISAYCVDETNATSNVAQSAIQIANSAPTISGASLTIDREADQASVNMNGADADGETITYTVTENDINQVVCTISSSTLTASRVSNFTGTSVCKVQVSDSEATADAEYTITVLPENKLSVDKAYAVINDDEERISDDDRFSIEPGDNLLFRFDIENLFDEDDRDGDITDVEIEIDIEEWDGDDDETETSDSYDIDAGETEEDIEVDWGEVPSDIVDGTHEVTITVTGRGDSGQRYEIVWTVDMDVEKENEMISIKRASIEDDTLDCDRYTRLDIVLENQGKKDSDEVVLTIYNKDLGIDIRELELNLDEGDDWSRSYDLDIPDDVQKGTYSIIARTFFDFDAWGDDETSQVKSLTLRIDDCAPVVDEDEPEEEVEETEDEEDVEVITDDKTDDNDDGFVIGEPPADISEEDKSSDEEVSPWYLIALVVIIVILIAVLIVMISVVLGKKNK